MNCPNCQTPIACTADTSCWCMALPKILPPSATTQCLCPNCLLIRTAQQVNQHPKQLSPSQKQQVMALGPPDQLQNGIDYSIINGGMMVFTPWYHLRKGYCCKNDCRHCPY